MKILAMYLPQFHRVKENDEWWGEGFTDWVTVRQAKPLSDDHRQPREPLGDNYYDLTDENTLRWQAELMKQYGIDGMCMYHYWFKDGRQILEKPAEILLNNKGIDMPFCFCWANETWARSWSALQGKNSWACKYEKEGSKGEKAILLEQQYGSKDAWKKHFEYLLPFFEDKRYIRVNDKPVFMFYISYKISRLEEMTDYWQELAVEHGLSGIYFIGAFAENTVDGILDEKMVPAPATALKLSLKGKKSTLFTDYSSVWENILNNNVNSTNVTYEALVDYDDTPRRGDKGNVLVGATPELFEKYLTLLLKKNSMSGSEFTFINAWNEWGEGMYLEPDTVNGTRYLEAVKSARENYKNVFCSTPVQAVTEGLTQLGQDKDSMYFEYLEKWMTLRDRAYSISEYFKENKIEKIALYGFGMFTKHLSAELENSEVHIEYIFDRQWRGSLRGIDGTECIPYDGSIDAVIVCSFFYFDDIYHTLKNAGYNNIISLRAIIEEKL